MNPEKKFKVGIGRDQTTLFPKRIEDYVGENHMVKLIVDICEMLDLSKITSKYSPIGQHAYNPRMMIGILFYGYAMGIRSSRKLADACKHRIDFIYITQWLTPSHDRIADFRRNNLEELKEIFTQIVIIGNELGLVKVGNLNVCLDSTKIRANASAKLTKDEKGLEKLIEDAKKEIAKMFAEAEKIDKEEDEKYGKQNSGTEIEIPKELQSLESRRKAIDKIIKNLETKIEQNAANKEEIKEKISTNVEKAKGLIKDILSKARKIEKIEEALQKLKKEKDEKKAAIKEEKGREPTKTELEKIEKTKINVTDNDARFMKQRNGVIKPNYNGQIVVDEENQFIVANDVTMECNDQHQLIHMTQKIIDVTGHKPKHLTSDNGYILQLEEATKKFHETVFLVDDCLKRKKDIDLDEIKKKYGEIRWNNLMRLLSEEGDKKYKKRMCTIEPVFGDMKFNKGYLHFLLRGLEKVKGEFNIMCISYNLRKIWSFLTKKGMDIMEVLLKKIKSRFVIQPTLTF